jgi:hypothetical protein
MTAMRLREVKRSDLAFYGRARRDSNPQPSDPQEESSQMIGAKALSANANRR